MKVNHAERFEWTEPDQYEYTPPPLREGDEMANPLDESDGIQDELDELEDELGEEPDVEPEEDTSIGDAGQAAQR